MRRRHARFVGPIVAAVILSAWLAGVDPHFPIVPYCEGVSYWVNPLCWGL